MFAASLVFIIPILLAPLETSGHEDHHSHDDHDGHVHHSEKIAEVAKEYINSRDFSSSPEFVFRILKKCGANINMPFSARSWSRVDEWGEDECWKPRQSADHPVPHIGDIVSNGIQVGIVTSLDPGKTTTVLVHRVQETEIGFTKSETFVIWCYVCKLNPSE